MNAHAAQASGTQTAAIVTTLRNAGATLDSFIKYHLSVGFSHIFLFFDDPDDAGIEIARGRPNVTVIRHDAELRRRWKRTRSYRMLGHVRRFIETEVMSRQVLNAEVAIGLAADKGFDWLLHIDSDELFHAPGQSAGAHFRSLAERGVRHVTYPNHEAAPETPDVADPFKEVTLFKKNPYTLSAGQMSDEQKAVIEELPQLPDKFFFFYRNGKSAARVSEGLLPEGVHGFRVEDNFWSRLSRRYLGGGAKSPAGKVPWFSRRPAARPAPAEPAKIVSDNACVLHYPCCGFAAFWNKYVTWGDFSDKWFGKMDIRERIGSFTLEARDVVLSGDREAAREFYKTRFVLGGEADTERLIEGGLCSRFFEPSLILAAAGAADAPAPPAERRREVAAQAL